MQVRGIKKEWYDNLSYDEQVTVRSVMAWVFALLVALAAFVAEIAPQL